MRSLVLAIALTAAILAGCSGGGASQLLETAKFEELQRNLPHARKLYAEIVEKYPGSPQANEAQRRLSALDASPTGG